MSSFPIFQAKHDPSGQVSGPWSFRFILDDGDLLTDATVVVVDDLDQPIVSDLTILDVSFAQVVEGETGANVWGVSFYAQNGSPQYYNVRCRYTTNHSPITGGDITMRLQCKNT